MLFAISVKHRHHWYVISYPTFYSTGYLEIRTIRFDRNQRLL